MRIAIVAIGSRGDVQPNIALGKGLAEAGHHVILATHDEFLPLFGKFGFEFASMKANPSELLEKDTSQILFETGGNFLLFFKEFARLLEPMMRQFVMETLRASENADMMILSAVGGFGFHVAEKLGIPYCQALLQPFSPTKTFENPVFPQYPTWIPFGRGMYNYQSFLLFTRLYWQFIGRVMNKIRKEMGLQVLNSKRLLRTMTNPDLGVLYGFSPSFIPPPHDWASFNHITGYWFLDTASDWIPPSELVDFLESGPPPVYIGFGSMRNREPEKITEIVAKALEKTRQRGVILTGYGGLSDSKRPDYLFPVDTVPHDWLFPRVSAVVHHGGAGTTGVGLRFGKPTAIVPFLGDQPFWGRRIYKAGVGAKPIPRKQLTIENLAEAITVISSDDNIKRRASALGEKIRNEDGVKEAVRIVSQFIKK